MTLPASGAISIDDILTELGRNTGEAIDTTDSELYQLAGKTVGQSLTFPADFYGKSWLKDFTVQISIADFSGLGFQYNNSVGSATPQTLNGIKVNAFGEGAYGFPANLRLSGRGALNGLQVIYLDSDGNSDTITIEPALYSFLYGYWQLPGYAPYNSSATFDVTLKFNEEYLICSGFNAESSGNYTGFEDGVYGTFSSAYDPMDFTLTGSVYTVNSINHNQTNNELIIKIDLNGEPNLQAADFKTLRLVYYNTSGTKQELTLDADDASFSITGGFALWTWTGQSQLSINTYQSTGYGFALII